MLIEKIREDITTARVSGDIVAKNLLITLYSEASMVGKNKRNGPSTDEEVVSTVKKFAANAEETMRLLIERGQDSSVQIAEIAILNKYLPVQLDQDSLEKVIRNIVSDLKITGPKAMGMVMSELKKNYSGCYDGKIASELAKTILV